MNKQENASSQYLAFASRCPTQWKAVHSFLILAHEFYQRQKNVAVYLGIHAAQKALEAEDANQHHSFLNAFLAYLEKEKDTHISPDEKGVAVLLDVAQRLTKAANVRKLKVQKSVSKKQEDVTTSLKMYHTAIQLLEATAQFGDRGEDVEDLYQSVLQEMVEFRDEKLSQADSSQIEAKSDQSTENSTALRNPVVNSPLSAVSGQKSSTPTAPQGACVTSTVTLPNYDSQREISASGWVPPAPHNVRPDKDTLDRILEAQKSCKAALSSITYSDVQGATAALEKALKILMQ